MNSRTRVVVVKQVNAMIVNLIMIVMHVSDEGFRERVMLSRTTKIIDLTSPSPAKCSQDDFDAVEKGNAFDGPIQPVSIHQSSHWCRSTVDVYIPLAVRSAPVEVSKERSLPQIMGPNVKLRLWTWWMMNQAVILIPR